MWVSQMMEEVTTAYRTRDVSPAPAGKTRRVPRQYRRVAVRCGCWLEHPDATVFGTTIDLGQGGLFLRTALPMPPGAEVEVTLQLPGVSEPVVASGQVVHRIAPEQGDRPGLGVRFVSLRRGEGVLEGFLDGSQIHEFDVPDVG